MFLLSVKFGRFLKCLSFERGFKSVGKVHRAFGIHFFVIMLIFVIFDLEVVLLLGFVVSDVMSVLGVFFVFIFVFGGFLMEWYYGKLIWLV